MLRRPVRAMLTTVGLAMAIAIVVFGGFTADALARIVDIRFQTQERQDMSVVLRRARGLEQWSGFERLPGVRLAEPYRAVPARIRMAGRIVDVSLLGLQSPSRLRRLVDVRYHEMSVPPEGAIVSAWLTAQTGLRRGDVIPLEIREGRRRMVAVRVVGLIDEPLGKFMYMDLRTLNRLLGEPNTFTAVNFLVDPVRARDLFRVLKRAPQSQSVTFRKASIANFRAMGDDAIRFIRQIEIIFAMIIAFGVVYNTARITVAERAHELATLRVIGFTRREISTVLLGELGLLATPAIPVGCVLGYALSRWFTTALSTDLFRMPAVVEPGTYAFAIMVFGAAASSSALLVRRRLDRLDLIAVLKARE